MNYLLLAALLLTGPSLAAPAPFVVGVSGAFTGGTAPMGLSMRNGIRLAAAEINADGGIHGRPIQLVERDDAGVPEQGVRVARELTQMGPLVAVIGCTNSAVALAAEDVYQTARLPLIIAVATATDLTRRHAAAPRNYIFRVSTADSIQAELIVQEAVERSRYRRLAVFADSSYYGQNGQNELRRALQRRGLQPVLEARFSPQERDMSRALQNARARGADAILTYALGPQLAAISNGMEQAGWRVPLIGSWTLSAPNFIDNAGPNAEGARMPLTLVEESQHPRQRAFVDRYRNTFHTRRIPSPSTAAQGYDAMLILAQALREARDPRPQTLPDTLENLKKPVNGVISSYRRPYSRTDHEAIERRVPVMAQVRTGRVEFVYPQDRQRSALP